MSKHCKHLTSSSRRSYDWARPHTTAMPKRHVAGRGTRWWLAHHVPSAEAGISSKRKCGVTCTNDGMEEGIQVSTYICTALFHSTIQCEC